MYLSFHLNSSLSASSDLLLQNYSTNKEKRVSVNRTDTLLNVKPAFPESILFCSFCFLSP